MLPKSRVWSILAVGVGLAMLLWGSLAPKLVHTDTRMPVDLQETTLTLFDANATSRVVGSGEVITGPVTRQLHTTILPPIDADVATLRVGITDTRGVLDGGGDPAGDLDNLIGASVWNYTIDRLSGAAQGDASVSDMLGTAPNVVTVDGVWLKFPSGAEQTTYDLFDATLRKPAPAVFEEKLDWDGRAIYRYRQDIEPVNLATSYAHWANTAEIATPQPGAEGEAADDAMAAEAAAAASAETPAETQKGYLFHSAQRDVYVDEISGLVVKVEEKVDDFYGTLEGERLADALVFEGTMSEEDVNALFEQAKQVSDGKAQRAINYGILVVGGILGAVGMLGALGLFGAFGAGRRRA